MVSMTVTLNNKSGLHARPASLFTKEAAKYQAAVKVIKDGQEYNAKSILSVLSMGAAQGTELTITAEGEDEEQALKALKELFDQNFGE
ncbi:MAG TPA: HPr family phosphocarrier protein [Hydrogenispora sp.]|jgi:phosphocarrier protein|nr:HPr family phosphocarrier protein [Hydrogenispora sp.]